MATLPPSCTSSGKSEFCAFGNEFPFKFSKSRDEVRDRFFRAISAAPFRVRAIVVEKAVIRSAHLQTDKASFYEFFVKQMLRHDNGRLTNAKVIIDGSGDPLNELVQSWSDDTTRTNLGERVRAAMRRKAVRGEVLGRPPYGYKVGIRRRLELVAEEAVVVRYIFRLYLQDGLGIRRIAGQLNDEAIPTRRGGRWSMVTVRDLLRNRVYLGTYTRFGVKVPQSHPPLVSAEEVASALDGRLVVLDDCGHVPYVEQPMALWDALQRFLS